MSAKLKVHFIGIHGVPAKYGGFETLVDLLCKHLSQELDITVYCSSKKYSVKEPRYYNASLKYLPLSASGFQGIIYDVVTLTRSLFKSDVIVYLSPVGSGFYTFLNVFFRKKLVINHGGLNEWEREKLSWFQSRYAKLNHCVAAKFASVNITDNKLYQKSLKDNFNADSIVVRYGGDHVRAISLDEAPELVEKYPFAKEKYAVSVSRAQIDNNLHIVLQAFEDFGDYKLVLISNWNISSYGRELYEKYKNNANIILLNAVYDKRVLDFIRSNACIYIHSHSRCGTAPSLVEAMCLGKAIVSFDVPTNRETTQDKAVFFSSAAGLKEKMECLSIEDIKQNGLLMQEIAAKYYSWSMVANQYLNIIKN